MYTPEALLDVHTRAHTSLRKLIEHTRTFSTEEFNRELEGFGYPSLQLQLDHAIGAQGYWVGVLGGEYNVEDNGDKYATPDALEAYRQSVAELVENYLRSADTAELNTPRTMWTWPGNERVLTPAHVIMRTQTHIYQHQGQVLAMIRLLGYPAPQGLDFPLVD